MAETPSYYTNAWDNSIPDGSSVYFGDVHEIINDFKLDVRERFDGIFPIGLVVKWMGDSVPDGFLELDGSAYDKADYPDLYTYLCDGGASCIYGETTDTFNVPDYRGKFVRGFDDGAGVDPDAASRGDRGDTQTGDVVGTIQSFDVMAHQHFYRTDDLSESHYIPPIGSAFRLIHVDTYDTENYGGDETRPGNKYVRYIICSHSFMAKTVGGVDVFDYDNEWDETDPAGDEYAGFGYREIQYMRYDLMQRFKTLFRAGQMAFWPTDTAPYGWLIADGSEISRTTYADLFLEYETMYGPGDGVSTFNIPDMRGLFVRSVDTSAAGVSADIDPNEEDRSGRGDGVGGAYVGSFQGAEIESHCHSVNVQDFNSGYLSVRGEPYGFTIKDFLGYTDYTEDDDDDPGTIQGVIKESRPINKTASIIIRAFVI